MPGKPGIVESYLNVFNYDSLKVLKVTLPNELSAQQEERMQAFGITRCRKPMSDRENVSRKLILFLISTYQYDRITHPGNFT